VFPTRRVPQPSRRLTSMGWRGGFVLMALPFVVLSTDLCRPALALRRLDAAGQLPRLNRIWGQSRDDCHFIAEALTRDVAASTLPIGPLPWRWVAGSTPRRGPHSWVECDGWGDRCQRGQCHRHRSRRLSGLDDGDRRHSAGACLRFTGFRGNGWKRHGLTPRRLGLELACLADKKSPRH
jgi:hypothetical protein